MAGTGPFWVVGNWSEVGSIVETYMVLHGGMTLFRGIAGGAVADVVVSRRQGLPTSRLLDLAMPGLAAASPSAA